MSLKIVKLGSQALRKKAAPVSFNEMKTRAFQSLLCALVDTMRKMRGVGIAAPQVDVSKQIFCVECVRNVRYPGTPSIPLYTVMNPKIRPISRQTNVLYEGCLSIPDLRGPVRRFSRVELTGWNPKAEKIRLVAEGFHARIIQHEFDHLHGRVYLDRMPSLKPLSYLEYLR